MKKKKIAKRIEKLTAMREKIEKELVGHMLLSGEIIPSGEACLNDKEMRYLLSKIKEYRRHIKEGEPFLNDKELRDVLNKIRKYRMLMEKPTESPMVPEGEKILSAEKQGRISNRTFYLLNQLRHISFDFNENQQSATVKTSLTCEDFAVDKTDVEKLRESGDPFKVPASVNSAVMRNMEEIRDETIKGKADKIKELEEKLKKAEEEIKSERKYSANILKGSVARVERIQLIADKLNIKKSDSNLCTLADIDRGIDEILKSKADDDPFRGIRPGMTIKIERHPICFWIDKDVYIMRICFDENQKYPKFQCSDGTYFIINPKMKFKILSTD